MIRVTRVSITFANSRQEAPPRLLAYASVTLDDAFVVYDLKVVETEHGRMVAMPSTPLRDRCAACHAYNPVSARYCGRCGAYMGEPEDCPSRRKHQDLCHPVTTECRQLLTDAVLAEYDVRVAAEWGEVHLTRSNDDRDSSKAAVQGGM